MFFYLFLFQMSNISLQRYLPASVGGMLPSQSLHAYIGSTLRSMEEVVSSSSSSSTAYIVFGGQVCDCVFCYCVGYYCCHHKIQWYGCDTVVCRDVTGTQNPRDSQFNLVPRISQSRNQSWTNLAKLEWLLSTSAVNWVRTKAARCPHHPLWLQMQSCAGMSSNAVAVAGGEGPLHIFVNMWLYTDRWHWEFYWLNF